MLSLKELRFKSIGRFVEEQVVDISSLSNFTQVDAENLNTGGSSGSGKSTVFHALEYLLGINDLPTTVLQSRLTKDPIHVSGKFDLDGKDLEITRSKAGLKIELDGKVTEGSSAVTEEKLDEILGMSRDLFRKTIHKRQLEGGFFLDFTPKKIHEFLTDCLGLGEFIKKSKVVDEKISELATKKDDAEGELVSTRGALVATQDAILDLGLAPVRDIHKEVILELKNKYDASSLRFKNVSETCERLYQEIEKERPSTSILPYDGRNREGLEGRRKEIESEISRLLKEKTEKENRIRILISAKNNERNKNDNKIVDGTRAKNEAAKIANEIKQIRDSKCPTCEQHWSDGSAKTTEQAKLADLANLKKTIDIGRHLEGYKPVLDQEISELEKSLPIENLDISSLEYDLGDILNKLSAERALEDDFRYQQEKANEALLGQLTDKLSTTRKLHAAEIEQARGQMDLDRRTLDIAVGKLRAYEEARVRYETQLSSLKLREENFTKQTLELEGAIVSTENKLILAEEVRRAIKTYISYSFDDALEIIGDNATKIIRCIPNMSNATIQFEGSKEAQNGKVKEEVNAVIGMDGEVGIPIKSLSGGERSSTDLAVDLAVIDFIQARTGKGMNIFILDEPFPGLGTVEIEMALEVLKNSNTNKKLIIVDHNPEVKQMVQSRLVVVREGLTSKVAS